MEGHTYIQNRNIRILQAVAPEKKRERTPGTDGFKRSYWGKCASGDNGFIHGADARQKGSFTSVLVHHCNIYIGKGNYAVRHRGKKNGQIFSPSGNLTAGLGPKDQSPVAVEKDTEGGK